MLECGVLELLTMGDLKYLMTMGQWFDYEIFHLCFHSIPDKVNFVK